MAYSEVTTPSCDSESRMRELRLTDGSRNTMSYRTDGLRHQLFDEEVDKRMVWDVPGYSGYGDLFDERLP